MTTGLKNSETSPKATHQDCSACGGHDCVTEWGNGNTYCHQCQAKTYNKEKREPMETEGLQLVSKPYRGLAQSTVDFFGIMTGVNAEGNDVTRVYPYPHRPKTRILPKDFSQNKGFTNDHLLGMDKFNAGSSKFITVVEGEDDLPAAYEMLGSKYPVVALPGAGTVKNILKNKKCYDYLDAFESIVICTDSDPAGDRGAQDLQRAFPGKTYRVNMSLFKDPMEYFEANKKSDFLYAWINRKKFVPENVFNTPDQFADIIRSGKGSMYIPTGIKQFDEKTLGLMQGYFTVFQAAEGIGKTELMRYLEYNILANHPTVPIAIMHLEETKKRSLLGLASYHLNKNVTLQDTETITKENGDEEIVYLPSYNGVPEDQVISAISELTGRENLYQFTIGVDEDPISIVDQIRYFAEVCGCKYVFFEPIQDLAYSRQDETTVESWLSQLSTTLGRLASELGIGIISIAHENDDGQIRDCRMIGKRAGVVVRLERDKLSTDEVMKNITTLTVLKNRPVSNTGLAGQIEFDPHSFTISEKEW